MDKKRAHYVVSVDRVKNLLVFLLEKQMEFEVEFDKADKNDNEIRKNELMNEFCQIASSNLAKNALNILCTINYLETIDPIFESKTQRLIHNAFFYAISGITGVSLFFATKYFF